VASWQLIDLPLYRLVDHRLCGFIEVSGAALRADRHGNRDTAEDISPGGRLSKGDFLRGSDDCSAMAEVAGVRVVTARHVHNLLTALIKLTGIVILPGFPMAAV
jgi:hypothetical protein